MTDCKNNVLSTNICLAILARLYIVQQVTCTGISSLCNEYPQPNRLTASIYGSHVANCLP